MDKCYRSLLSFIRTLVNFLVVLLSLPTIIVAKKTRIVGSGCIHVLGNGPSLKNDYPELLSTLSESDSIMVVNTFGTTDLFDKLKPQFYIIVDPAFFKEKTEQRIIELRNKTFDALISKTKWDLQLFVPYTVRKSPLLLKLEENKHIHVNYFLNIPAVDGSECVHSFLFKNGLANPPYRNVLIAAIYHCIKLKFSKIVVWGADHSWHEDFILGNDNTVYTVDKHFYSEEVKGFAHLNQYGKPIKVHEEFYSIAQALKVYHTLERFSRLYHCKIINKSSKTWIDAFSRE